MRNKYKLGNLYTVGSSYERVCILIEIKNQAFPYRLYESSCESFHWYSDEEMTEWFTLLVEAEDNK